MYGRYWAFVPTPPPPHSLLLLLMIHHGETQINANRNRNSNPKGGTKVQQRRYMLFLGIEKKESKTPKVFQKLLEQIRQSPQHNQNRQGQTVEEMFMRKLTKNQTYLEILVLYLNSPSEQTTFGINKIKEQQ